MPTWYEEEVAREVPLLSNADLANDLENLGRTMRKMPPGERIDIWLDARDEEVCREAARRLKPPSPPTWDRIMGGSRVATLMFYGVIVLLTLLCIIDLFHPNFL